MKFLISVIDDLSVPTTPAEMAQIDKFNDDLRSNNQFIFAWGLESPTKATLIDNRNDAGISKDQPLFSAQENVSGFWIIEVTDEDTAHNLAMAGSKACNRRVELRPFHN
jgi:hypothetical protein